MDLKDYSGEYQPNLKPEDFSKETLSKLLTYWGRLFLLLEHCWYDAVRKNFGDQASEDMDTAVWQEMPKFEIKYICKVLGIEGNDLKAFFKLWQWGPGLMGVKGSFDYDVDFKDENHAVLTVNRCFAYEIWEYQGDEDRMRQVCEGMDTKAIATYAKMFNPNMVATPIRCGPRKSKDAPHCAWDFKIVK